MIKQKSFFQKCYEKLTMVQFFHASTCLTIVKDKNGKHAMALSILADGNDPTDIIPIAIFLSQKSISEYTPLFKASEMAYEITENAKDLETRGLKLDDWHKNHEAIDNYFNANLDQFDYLTD